jgi:antitoxin MazE
MPCPRVRVLKLLAILRACNYCNYMETLELKITRIGNSRGLRLPARIISKYKLGEAVILEQRPDEIALRPKKQKKLSWKDTYKEMAAASEDWSDMDKLSADGLE